MHETLRIAMNNAVWCDLICRLHGRSGRFTDALWASSTPSPPFYPNAVTIADDDAAIRTALGALAKQLTGSSWAVKDSLDRLDLSAAGFERLFRAEWIVRPAGLKGPELQHSDLRWERVERAEELDEWERAWRQAGNDPQDHAWTRIFPSPLLTVKDVVVSAGYRDRRIVAGAIANVAAGYVGLTNVFSAEADGAGAISGLIDSVAALFPDMPLSGYESGEQLELMQSLGFMPAGPLAVWIKSGGHP